MLLFLFATDHRYVFLLFLEPRDRRKVSQRNLYCLLEIRVLKNLCLNCRSMILKECDSVNSTTNLSTWRHWINQSMIPESGIMEQRHQRHVCRLRHPFPLPRIPLSSLCLLLLNFLFDPIFCLSPTAKPCPRLISRKIELVSSAMEHDMHELFCCLARDCNYRDKKLQDVNFKSRLYRPCHDFRRHLDE